MRQKGMYRIFSEYQVDFFIYDQEYDLISKFQSDKQGGSNNLHGDRIDDVLDAMSLKFFVPFRYEPFATICINGIFKTIAFWSEDWSALKLIRTQYKISDAKYEVLDERYSIRKKNDARTIVNGFKAVDDYGDVFKVLEVKKKEKQVKKRSKNND